MASNLENEALEALVDTGKNRSVVPHNAVDRFGRPLVRISASDVSLTTATYSTLSPSKATVTTDAQILASNASRQGGVIKNLGGDTVYISDTTATTNDYPLDPGEVYYIPIGYTGAIRAISDGTSDVRILEGSS